MIVSFKFRVLAPLIERELFQEYLDGNFNWLSDCRLTTSIRNKFGVQCKEDDVRRTALDMWKMGWIQKFPRKSLYKFKGGENHDKSKYVP